MTVDERALPERLTWPIVGFGQGEVCNLHDPEEAADWAERIGQVMSELRRMKTLCDEALRGVLGAEATASLIVSPTLEVTEEPGRVTYDGEVLYQGLVAAGLHPDVVAEMFKPTLRDARELGKLERRNDKVAKAAEAARTRSRGRIVVKRKKGHVDSAAIPEAVHREVMDNARVERETEARAEELGL